MALNPMGFKVQTSEPKIPPMNPLGMKLDPEKFPAVVASTPLGHVHDGTLEDCFGCKVKTLAISDGAPKSHIKDGNPWASSPVIDRIEELSRQSGQSLEINRDIPRAEGATQ